MKVYSCLHCGKPINQDIKFCPFCGKEQIKFDREFSTSDPYSLLQISQEAEKEVITAAYKSLARKYHPDLDPSESANKKMQEINWAYDILSDSKKRKAWDQTSNKTPPKRKPV